MSRSLPSSLGLIEAKVAHTEEVEEACNCLQKGKKKNQSLALARPHFTLPDISLWTSPSPSTQEEAETQRGEVTCLGFKLKDVPIVGLQPWPVCSQSSSCSPCLGWPDLDCQMGLFPMTALFRLLVDPQIWPLASRQVTSGK